LALRGLRPADAKRLVFLMRDKAISEFIARTTSDEDARTFAITVCGGPVGVVGLHRTADAGPDVCAVGYWIGARRRGKGLMTEAFRRVLSYARDGLGAKAIIAGQFTDNPASAAVLHNA
jgi:RimJ/RimL family protein N-acetyltransferase